MDDHDYLRLAMKLALEGMAANAGGPFGAVVVKGDRIVGRGWNQVTSRHDPTAHAEIMAIREACQELATHDLQGCTLYTSCEPCPMCLGAIYWAHLDRIVYACERVDAAAIGFDDDAIYREIALPLARRRIPLIQGLQAEGRAVFEAWQHKTDRTPY